MVYDIDEMVEHLIEEHDIEPEEINISGMLKRHQKKYDRTLEEYLEEEEEEEEDEEEEEESDSDEDEAYTAEELGEMDIKELQEILKEWEVKVPKKASKKRLVKTILDAQEAPEEEDEEEEDEEFTPFTLSSADVKSFRKSHKKMTKDEVQLIVDYANQEEIPLSDAADDLGYGED